MQKIIYALLIAGSLSGCFFNEITDSETVVLLEDVIYVSSNDIRLLGRLYSLEGTASDHGFEFSKDETFSAPEVVSLGEKRRLVLFFSEFNLLEEKQPITTVPLSSPATISSTVTSEALAPLKVPSILYRHFMENQVIRLKSSAPTSRLR